MGIVQIAFDPLPILSNMHYRALFFQTLSFFLKVPQTIRFYSFPYQVVVMFVSEENIVKRSVQNQKMQE